MANWLPSLNALRAFETTERDRSYKKAAAELSVTPAAVKQLVTKLEQAIGEPLLVFLGNHMEMTQIGAQGFMDLTNAFLQISFAVQRMRDNRELTRLVVSVEPSFASAWLVPRLQSFKALHPRIEILVSSSMEIADLDGGMADIGIHFGVSPQSVLITHRLFDEHLSALCSPGLAYGPPGLPKLEDIKDIPHLRWDLSDYGWATTTAKWNHWLTWLDAVGASRISPRMGVKFTDYNQAVQAAVAGQGFVLGSKTILKSFLEKGLLVDPFGVSAHPIIGYNVVTTASAMKSQNVRDFVDWIMVEAGELWPSTLRYFPVVL